jgi:hypothetical protein
MDPNNFKTIMVGHTFSKLYPTVFHLKLSRELERRQLSARGQVGFRLEHQTIDHILTLRAIIEEARHRSSKLYYCSVDFQKDLCSLLKVALFQRLRDIGISDTLLSSTMCLYESFIGRLCTAHEISDFIRTTLGQTGFFAPCPPHCLGSTLMSWSLSCMSTSKTKMGILSTKS